MFFFTCVGVLLFGEIADYESFGDTFIMLFQSALGSWNFGIYEGLHIGKYVGIIFHICVLIMNLLLLLNLIIAILANTFAYYDNLSLALYYDGVIEAMPMYKYSSQYGALVCCPPPFNVLILPFTPLFLIIEDEAWLRKLNNFLMYICYFPSFLIATIVFLIVNALLLVPAYFAAIFYKINNVKIDRKRGKAATIMEVILFVIFGPVFLAINFILDLIYFWIHLFGGNVTKLSIYNRQSISLFGFVALKKQSERSLEEYEFEPKKHMPMFDFSK